MWYGDPLLPRCSLYAPPHRPRAPPGTCHGQDYVRSAGNRAPGRLLVADACNCGPLSPFQRADTQAVHPLRCQFVEPTSMVGRGQALPALPASAETPLRPTPCQRRAAATASRARGRSTCVCGAVSRRRIVTACTRRQPSRPAAPRAPINPLNVPAVAPPVGAPDPPLSAVAAACTSPRRADIAQTIPPRTPREGDPARGP